MAKSIVSMLADLTGSRIAVSVDSKIPHTVIGQLSHLASGEEETEPLGHCCISAW